MNHMITNFHFGIMKKRESSSMVEGLFIVAILILIVFAVVNIKANNRLHETYPELKRIVKLQSELDDIEAKLDHVKFEQYLIMRKKYLLGQKSDYQ